MGIKEALFDRLSNYSAYASQVGGAGNACRLYPERTPDKPAVPYTVYEVDEDTDPGHAMGVDVAPKFADARFWTFATTGDEAQAIALLLIAGLRRYAGVHGAITLDDCYVRGNRPVVDDDTKLLGRLVEFRITYRG